MALTESCRFACKTCTFETFLSWFADSQTLDSGPEVLRREPDQNMVAVVTITNNSKINQEAVVDIKWVGGCSLGESVRYEKARKLEGCGEVNNQQARRGGGAWKLELQLMTMNAQQSKNTSIVADGRPKKCDAPGLGATARFAMTAMWVMLRERTRGCRVFRRGGDLTRAKQNRGLGEILWLVEPHLHQPTSRGSQADRRGYPD